MSASPPVVLPSATIQPPAVPYSGTAAYEGSVEPPAITYTPPAALCVAVLQALGYKVTAPSTGTGTGTSSPAKSGIKAGSAALLTALGTTWGINAAGQVTVGGTADTATGAVLQLWWDGTLMWQQNSAGDWYSKSSPTAAWSAATTTLPAGATSAVSSGGGTGTGTGTGGTAPTAITYTQYTPAAPLPGVVGSGTGPWNGTLIDENGNLDGYYGGKPVPASQLPGAPGGNWNNNVTIAYGQPDPAGGSGTCAIFTPGGNWPQALLHAIGQAGSPMPNGIGSDMTGATEFVVDVYPFEAGLQLAMDFFTEEGEGTYQGPNTTVVDEGYPQGATTIATAANLPAAKWTRIRGPMSALNWPLKGGTAEEETSSTWSYKESLQQQLPQAGMKMGVRNWAYPKNAAI